MSDSDSDSATPVTGQPLVAELPEDSASDIPVDLAFDLLTNDRRRSALLYLFECERATLRDVAEHVAAWETNTTVGAVSTETRRRIYTGLYHSHVPKLADAGVIEYDAEQDFVTLTDLATSLVPYLEIAAGDWR